MKVEVRVRMESNGEVIEREAKVSFNDDSVFYLADPNPADIEVTRGRIMAIVKGLTDEPAVEPEVLREVIGVPIKKATSRKKG
jgi:hypothetical protein